MTTTTKTTTKTTVRDGIAAIPVAVAGEHQPLPAELLPAELVPSRDDVLRTHAAYRQADTERRDARKVAASADADHKAALAQAAANGTDPATVTDQRPAKAAALATATERCKALEQAANGAWNAHVRGVVEHRDQVLAPIEDTMVDLQADVLAAEQALLAAHARLRQATGVHTWVRGLRAVGGINGVSTAQGPRALGIGGTITYLDRGGMARTMDVNHLVDALSVWCRGADIAKAVMARDEAIARRVAGDPQAQREPVPSPRLTVR